MQPPTARRQSVDRAERGERERERKPEERRARPVDTGGIARQHARQQPRALVSNLVPAQVQVSQRLAIPERRRQQPRALIADPVLTQTEVRQHLAPSQQPSQIPHPLDPKP
eukprot:1318635-Rhodomonas_salina.1